ncbi:MAG: hypothetical protein JNM17_03230 [Archangium sp.]|nr:hypothetical protein [Archangium sp.]
MGLVHDVGEDWFDQEPRCAKHAHLEALKTCARCGTFCCESCLTQAWCEACAGLVMRDHLPGTARSVAWKLLIAPLFFVGSSLYWLARGNELPALAVFWFLPLVCSVIVARRFSPAAAWTGAVSSLLLLGWQALTLFTAGEEMRLIDVALLAIAPVLALNGASHLSKLFARVRVLNAVT